MINFYWKARKQRHNPWSVVNEEIPARSTCARVVRGYCLNLWDKDRWYVHDEKHCLESPAVR